MLPGGARVIDAGVDVPGGFNAGLALSRDLHGRPGRRGLHAAADRRRRLARRDGLDRSSGGRRAWRPSTRAGRSRSASSSGWAPARYGRTRGWSGSCSRSWDTRKRPARGVLVLESRTLPTDEVADWVARKARLTPSDLTFVVAPTASLAGGVQISARILETGLHKMETLGFDVRRVVSAMGTAPIPPVAKNDLRAIGRTNDCILYGGQARYTIRAGDAELAELADEGAGVRVARLRHPVLRHLPALRGRLLQDRPAALQPRGGLAHEHGDRPDLPRRTASTPRC